jgi:low affinity Fe/Cu permease
VGLHGPFFHFNSTWQLVINTGTTIVTFLMVFLIQCMQNRDTCRAATQARRTVWAIAAADNDMIEVEHKGERTIEHLRENLRSTPPTSRPTSPPATAADRRRPSIDLGNRLGEFVAPPLQEAVPGRGRSGGSGAS